MRLALALLGLCLQAAQDEPAALAERLSSDDIELRERAAEALVRQGAAARPALLALRQSSDPETARLARRTLGHIDWDPCLAPCFQRSPGLPFELLGSPDENEFQAGFLKLPNPAVGRARDADRSEARRKFLFMRAGIVDDDLLRAWALGLDPEAFWNGQKDFAHVLYLRLEGRAYRGERFPYLKPLLGSPARSRRALAAMVLSQEADPEALEALLEFMGDKEDFVAGRTFYWIADKKYEPARERVLREAMKPGGHSAAFPTMTLLGWDGHLDALRSIARDPEALHWASAHQELARRGDRSALPDLLERVREEKGATSFMFESPLDSAFAYDTGDAIQAAVACLDRTTHWGAHGVDVRVWFGPRGARFVWDRFVKECRELSAEKLEKSWTGMYVDHFCRRKDLEGPAREALHADVPARVLELAISRLGEPGERDLVRLREISRKESGEKRPATTFLLSQGDRETRARIAREGSMLAALFERDPGEFRGLALRIARDEEARPEARRTSIEALGRIGVPEDAAALIDLLPKMNRPLQESTVGALFSFPDDALRGRLGDLERLPDVTMGLVSRLDGERGAELARAAHPPALEVLSRSSRAGDVPLARPHSSEPAALRILAEWAPQEFLPLAFRRALDPARRREGYELLGLARSEEAVEFLCQAARTEWSEEGRAAVLALCRIGGLPPEGLAKGGGKVHAFLRECMAEEEAGRCGPELWPLLAVRLGEEAAVPALRKRVERGPDPVALRALDLLSHREAYSKIRPIRYGPVAPKDLGELFSRLGAAYGIACEVSPAVTESFRALMHPAVDDEDRVTAWASIGLDLRGSLPDVLIGFEPRVTHSSGSRYGRWSTIAPVEWAPVLDGSTLRILTRAEAQAWWRGHP